MKDGIIFGAATSAYQIEGNTFKDGACSSNWHEFAMSPGKIKDGTTGLVACDHYNRYREDVTLLKDIGFDAYRFSVSWGRIYPEGVQKSNGKGLAFYDRLIDELLKSSISPYLTLFHWDLPVWLAAAGGWSNRDTAFRFRDYAGLLFGKFGDRVKNWITLNEPWCVSFLGYWEGNHAPGIRNDFSQVLSTTHHQLLAHGLSVEAFRSTGSCKDGRIGISLNPLIVYPSDSKNRKDIKAAETAWEIHSAFYLDPIYKKHYPEIIMNFIKRFQPFLISDNDMNIIGGKMDFLGINYYCPSAVKADSSFFGFTPVRFSGKTRSYNILDWAVSPEGLYDLLNKINHEYTKAPIIITENGYPLREIIPEGRKMEMDDSERIQYIKDHIGIIKRAVQSGIPVTGYFVWSLLDNFEWAEGYEVRFGIVGVDFKNQKRIPKKSALWLKDFLTGNKTTRKS